MVRVKGGQLQVIKVTRLHLSAVFEVHNCTVAQGYRVYIKLVIRTQNGTISCRGQVYQGEYDAREIQRVIQIDVGSE